MLELNRIASSKQEACSLTPILWLGYAIMPLCTYTLDQFLLDMHMLTYCKRIMSICNDVSPYVNINTYDIYK